MPGRTALVLRPRVRREVVYPRALRISIRISCAASGMFVPGPKMARTPALRRKLIILVRDYPTADDDDILGVPVALSA